MVSSTKRTKGSLAEGQLLHFFKIDVFSHGVFGLGRFGPFGGRLALLRPLHIPELLAHLLRGPEDGQEEIKDEFVQQVQYDPQKKYIC